MKAKTLNAWPSLIADSGPTSMTAYPTRKKRQGVVKLLPSPTPPDEDTINRLNALAGQQPFCNAHKVKKHELF